jgi:DNA replication licensing factor MCM3
MQINTSSTP